MKTYANLCTYPTPNFCNSYKFIQFKTHKSSFHVRKMWTYSVTSFEDLGVPKVEEGFPRFPTGSVSKVLCEKYVVTLHVLVSGTS